jgi:hypothetical protein
MVGPIADKFHRIRAGCRGGINEHFRLSQTPVMIDADFGYDKNLCP